MQRVPPFYENFDNTHCVQCVLRGVLEYFEPNTTWTWDQLDALTGKEPGKWTWPYRGQINITERGYDMVSISTANLDEYIRDGIYPTLLNRLGKEAADAQQRNADFDKVMVDLKQYVAFMKEGKIKRLQRHVKLSDLQNLLSKGYLIHSSCNWRKMYGQKGYSSHSILVYKITPHFVYFHDSGKPPVPHKRVSHARFIAASTDPTPHQWGITAYRKKA